MTGKTGGFDVKLDVGKKRSVMGGSEGIVTVTVILVADIIVYSG